MSLTTIAVPAATSPSLAAFKAMISISEKECRSFFIPCPEDVTIDHQYERVYISSCSRPRLFRSGYLGVSGYGAGTLDLPFTQPSADSVNGAILTLDLHDLDRAPANQTAEFDGLDGFRPVGIDLFLIDNTQARLFVTDRPKDGRARVIIFDVDRTSGALSRPKFIEDERFIRAPNEIAAVSADAFYLTNSQGGRFGWQQMWESFIPIGFGSIIYCRLEVDGPVFRVEDAFKNYPNGVAYEGTTKRLYVAAPPAKKVLVYGVASEKADPRLVPLDEIDVSIAADNLTWDTAGNLWVAGSPDLMAAVIYMAGDQDICPSQIMRIVDPSGATRVEPIFSDDGHLISASSVGAYHQAGNHRQLVIGAPFQDRLLVVDL